MREAMYRAARQRVTELATTLSADQLRTPVPATPGWMVHQLLAHLVGFASDVCHGRLDGAPGERWTARHVTERSDLSVDELVSEWTQVARTVERILAERGPAVPELIADIIGHEADLREALGLASVDRDHWQPVLETLMRLMDRRLQQHGAALAIYDERGQQWRCGSGEPVTTLHTTGYELLRGAFSRRSQRQLAAWDWTPTPPASVISEFGYFGPRDDDQPVPPAGVEREKKIRDGVPQARIP